MISFFTSLKPFRGDAALQQYNALRSWRAVVPESEIIVFGAVEGGDEVLGKVDAIHRQDIACNEFGTPLISEMFAEAQRIGRYPTLCFINGDIILLSDFPDAIARLEHWRTFAAVGQRWDLDWKDAINFADGWEESLGAVVATNGRQHDPVAMDYFAFRRGAVGTLPSFAIGRPSWDNYLVMHLCRRGVPIVDLSRVVAPVHQNHDYRHVAEKRGMSWEGPEGDRNRALASDSRSGFNPRFHSIRRAQWVMTDRWVLPALSPRRAIWRFMSIFPDRLRDIGHVLVQALRHPSLLAALIRKRCRDLKGA
jgi:hypothetical protein